MQPNPLRNAAPAPCPYPSHSPHSSYIRSALYHSRVGSFDPISHTEREAAQVEVRAFV
jgi:hypothetical protein